ncbi:unnamed protein product [Linum trigynum]
MAERKDQIVASEEPPSPKRQKSELGGADDHLDEQQQQQQQGAIEPVEEQLTDVETSDEDEDEAARNNLPITYRFLRPESKFHEKLAAIIARGSSYTTSDAEDQEIRKEETASIARLAVKFYNRKHGVNYVLHEALFSRSVLFHLAMACHATFTAREENSTSTHEFFVETLQYYGDMGIRILDCIDLTQFGPDRVRKGCVYCHEDMVHPHVECCQYGTDESADHKKFYKIK